MKRLILLRHAKSAWDDPGLSDHDRPLARRGRLAAPLMGAWLAEQGWAPDWALVSTSRRTRETWAGLARTCPGLPAPQFEPRLYDAAAKTVSALVAALPPSAERALLLGHNPGLEEAASAFAGAPLRLPTAAVAAFDGPDDWSAWSPDTARLVAHEAPKTLV